MIRLGLVLLMTSCGLATTRPKLEMAMARVAFTAAKDSKGQKYANDFYRKAEHYYLKAKTSYRRKNFNKAKQYAIISKRYSENAEFVSLRKQSLENLLK